MRKKKPKYVEVQHSDPGAIVAFKETELRILIDECEDQLTTIESYLTDLIANVATLRARLPAEGDE